MLQVHLLQQLLRLAGRQVVVAVLQRRLELHSGQAGGEKVLGEGSDTQLQ